MTAPLTDQQLAEIRAELGPADWPSEIIRLRALVTEMTRCRDNALAALYRDDIETDPHLPDLFADGLHGLYDWEHEAEPDQAPQELVDRCVRIVRPAFGKLTQQLERQDGEARFWEFEYREAMDNYKGEAAHAKSLRAELEQALAEQARFLAMYERGYEQHMQFGVISPDGEVEQLPCADWCYACKLAKARVEGEPLRAAHFREAARLLEAVDCDDDAVNLLDNVAAGIEQQYNAHPACTCGARPVHQSGCDTDQDN